MIGSLFVSLQDACRRRWGRLPLCVWSETHVLDDAVDQVWLRKGYCSVVEVSHFYSKVLIDFYLVCYVEALTHLLDAFVDMPFVRPKENPVIGVDAEDGCPLIEYALVRLALNETHLLESLEKVLLPYSPGRFAAIQVLQELQTVCFARISGRETSWYFHV